MSTNGIVLTQDDFLPPWSPTSSDVADLNEVLPFLDNEMQEQKLRALELAVQQLNRRIEVLEREAEDLRTSLEDTEDWKVKFTEWGESLMNVLFGPVKENAPRINALSGWMEQSPV